MQRTVVPRVVGGTIAWRSLDGARHSIDLRDPKAPCTVNLTFPYNGHWTQLTAECRDGAERFAFDTSMLRDTRPWKLGHNALPHDSTGSTPLFATSTECDAGTCSKCSASLDADLSIEMDELVSQPTAVGQPMPSDYARKYRFEMTARALSLSVGACSSSPAIVPTVSIRFEESAADFHDERSECIPDE